jgi:chromosome segregation ATPase
MTDSDLTVAILRDIRDRLDGTNSRLDTLTDAARMTNERLDQTNERLDQTNERLDQMNQRLTVVEHTVSDAAGQIVLLARYVKNKHETAIDDLRERVTRLEAKAR